MNNSSAKKHSIWTWIAAIIFIVVLLLCMVPMLLSTRFGTNLIVNAINKRIDGTLAIKNLSLSLWGSQSVEELELHDKEGNLIAHCPSLQSDQPLWNILFFHNFGTFKAEHPDISLRTPVSTITFVKRPAIQKAAFFAMPDFSLGSLSAFKKDLSGAFTIADGSLQVISPGLDPITFQQIQIQLDMPARADYIDLDCSCKTQQQQREGEIAVKARVSQLKAPFPQLNASAAVTHLPVRGIDQIISQFQPQYSGILLNAFGQTLTMHLQAASSAEAFDFNWDLQSANFQGAASARAENNILTLKAPATLTCTATPGLVQKLVQIAPAWNQLELQQPAALYIRLEEFTLPMQSTGFDLSALSFSGTVSASAQTPFIFHSQPLILDSLNVTASANKLQTELLLNGFIQAHMQNNTASSVDFQGKITDGGQAIDGFLKIQKLPVDLIAVFAQTNMPLSTYIGPTIDMNAAVQMSGARRVLHITAASPLLQIPSIELSLEKGIRLNQQAVMTYTLKPDMVNGDFLQLENPVPLKCVLTDLQLPSWMAYDQIQATLDVTAGSIPFAKFFGPKPCNITHAEASLAVKTLNQIALSFTSDPLKGSAACMFRFPGQIVFTKPLVLESSLCNPLQAFLPEQSRVLQPPPMSLAVDPFTLDLNNPNQLKIKGLLKIPQLTVANAAQTQDISLQNAQIPFQYDAKSKSASLQLSASLQGPTQGSIQAQAAFNNFATEPAFDLSTASVQATCDLQNIDTSFIDTLAGKSLAPLIGPSFNFKLKLESSPTAQTFSLKAVSSLFNADMSLASDSQSLHLQGGNGQITWTLTPEGYRILDKTLTSNANSPFDLSGPTTFNASLSKLYIPLLPPEKTGKLEDRIPRFSSDLSQLNLVSSGKNSGLSFIDNAAQEKIQLTNLTYSINKDSALAPIAFNLSSAVSNSKTGSFTASGSFSDFFNDKGEIDMSRLSSIIDVKIDQFPSRALDLLARAKGATHFPFTKIFGATVSATLSTQLAQFSGPIKLNLNSPNARASLSGSLDKGTLLLNEPLHAQIALTPEGSKLFLHEVNPLGITSVDSQAPITIEIAPQGFLLPLNPFNMSLLQIPNGRIELGKIHCHNEGNINVALGLLKSKQFEKGKDMTLWFAPIDFHMKNGVADIERTEILLSDTFDIAVWGNIDFVNDYVDMILGLTAQTLKKAFGIKELPEKYVLTIPMKGRTDDVQINTSKATAKIALLLAWQQKSLAGAAAGGPAGAIIGGLLSKVAQLPDINAKVPPAKRPFPWEVGKKGKETSQTSQGKKKHFKKKEQPIKQILKVIR